MADQQDRLDEAARAIDHIKDLGPAAHNPDGASLWDVCCDRCRATVLALRVVARPAEKALGGGAYPIGFWSLSREARGCVAALSQGNDPDLMDRIVEVVRGATEGRMSETLVMVSCHALGDFLDQQPPGNRDAVIEAIMCLIRSVGVRRAECAGERP